MTNEFSRIQLQRVEDVLKQNAEQSVLAYNIITIERDGGKVRLPLEKFHRFR